MIGLGRATMGESHTDETSEVTSEIASSIETAGLNVGAFRIVVRNSAINPKRTMPTKRLLLALNGTLQSHGGS